MTVVAEQQIGASVPRIDGRAKVTGAARFVDDLPAPGALHGATVRSTAAHGVLRAVEPDPAFDWHDIVVVTAADVPGRNVVLLDDDDQPALVAVGGEVRHVGEAVALVAAPTRRRAREAAAHMTVRIDPLPAVFGIDEALDGAVVLGEGTNVFRELHLGHGDVDAAMAAADLVIEGEYRTGPAEHVYLEPQGMVAQWQSDGSVLVTGSMQCPYYVHRALVELLALHDEAVVVRQAVTGGGFGGKEEYPSMLAAHAALLARAAGRPVKLVYDRDEDIAVTTKRHPSLVRHRLGLSHDGTMLAADVDLVLDGGAYVTVSPVVLLRACAHAAGPYRMAAVRVRGRLVYTNHHPSGAFRGFGAPQAHFAAERQVDKAARALRMDPWELRRRNALAPGDLTATGGRLDDSAGLPQVLDALAQQLARPAPPGRRAPGAVRRSRGIAAGFHGTGFSGSGEAVLQARASVARRVDGRFEVRVSSTDVGQGAATVLAQIAATCLGVELESVDVATPDTSVVPDSGPTVASRTTMVVGRVVEQAARRLRQRLDTGDLPDDEEVVETAVYELPPDVHWDQDTMTGEAYPSYGWSACAVDVAVDDDTSEVTIERCVHVVDVGRAINPLLLRGQVQGGTLQSLGWALWERCVREDGHVLTTSLSTYTIPTALEAPEFEVVLVEVPFRYGPFGAKGIGELPVNAPAPAVANALQAALGVDVDELPLVAEVLQRRLREDAS
jgi:CO/xanthine dehydrogenase Mo-binding subunit